MKNFKVVAQLLVGYFWLVMKMKKIKELLILIATLATTEVSVGALAKADQNIYFQLTNFLDKSCPNSGSELLHWAHS